MSSGRTIRKIRRAAVEQLVREGVPPMGAKASFDAILAEVERAAAEKALDRCVGEMPIDPDWKNFYADNNPYRAAALGLTAGQEGGER